MFNKIARVLMPEWLRSPLRQVYKLRSGSGVGLIEQIRLSWQPDRSASYLKGRHIQITDAFWYRHSLQEIFIEEVYNIDFKKENPVIIDCGANIGLSIIYMKEKYPNSVIHAFEPDPVIFQKLSGNVKQFGYSNVSLYQKAVWIHDEGVQFEASGGLGSRITREAPTNEGVVESVSLKDFLQQFAKIDFLKLDIEGAEIEVIEDCRDSLGKVDFLFIEYHRYRGSANNFSTFLGKIEEAGFRVYIKEAWNNLPMPFQYDKYKSLYDLQLNIFCFRQ